MNPDSMGSLDPDPDPGEKKGATKIEKVLKISFLQFWMFSFENCSLEVCLGGLGISKCNF